MGGDFVGQGLPDDLPDSPEDDEGVPATGDDAADDTRDSQADDVSDDADDDAEGDKDDEEKDDDDESLEGDDDGTGKGASPTYEKLLEKYGGDPEKLANAYIEQANSLADLAREVQGIKQYIDGQRTEVPKLSPEERKQRIAEFPDVVEADEELASIEADIKSEQDDYKNLIAEVGKTEKMVARLQGKLEASYDENKPSVQAELSSAEAKYERALDKFKSADRNIKKLHASFNRAKRRMEKAEQKAAAEIDREGKQKQRESQDEQKARTEFAGALVAEAKARNIPTNSKQFQVLFDTVQSRLWAYTQTLPEDHEGIDIPWAVKKLVGQYFEMGFGGKSFQDKSREKRKAAARRKKAGRSDDDSDSDTSKGKEPVRDAAWWERRAKRLLGG